MSKPTLEIGKLITKPEGKDAIHIAVAPVIANRELKPGQHVGLLKGSSTKVSSAAETLIGIVDPFLTQNVEKGKQFWLFLYPNTVTSLKHEWTHPAFNNEKVDSDLIEIEKQKQESREWLANFGGQLGMTYQEVIDAAADFIKTGEVFCLDFDTPDICYSQAPEMWKHIAIVESNPFDLPDNMEESIFRCAC